MHRQTECCRLRKFIGRTYVIFSAFEHPEKFGYAGVFSPAFLCYTREDWAKYLSTKIVENMPYLYIYTGNGDELEEMILKAPKCFMNFWKKAPTRMTE